MITDDELQSSLFPESESEPEWASEWQGMPEFVQEKQRPFSMIIVRCQTEDDLKDLSRILGQKLTAKTKSVWHPARSHWGNGHAVKRWTDES